MYAGVGSCIETDGAVPIIESSFGAEDVVEVVDGAIDGESSEV